MEATGCAYRASRTRQATRKLIRSARRLISPVPCPRAQGVSGCLETLYEGGSRSPRNLCGREGKRKRETRPTAEGPPHHGRLRQYRARDVPPTRVAGHSRIQRRIPPAISGPPALGQRANVPECQAGRGTVWHSLAFSVLIHRPSRANVPKAGSGWELPPTPPTDPDVPDSGIRLVKLRLHDAR